MFIFEILKKIFIYPYEVSFIIEGSTEKNFQVLNEFINSNSFEKTGETKDEITFIFLVSKIIGGWGLNAAIGSLKRFSENRSKMTFEFKIYRNLMWSFSGLFYLAIIYNFIQYGDWLMLLWIPGIFLLFNFISFFGSIFIAWIKLRLFFKVKLFQAWIKLIKGSSLFLTTLEISPLLPHPITTENLLPLPLPGINLIGAHIKLSRAECSLLADSRPFCNVRFEIIGRGVSLF